MIRTTLFTGKLDEDELFNFLYKIHTDKISGTFTIKQNSVQYEITIKNGIIIFVNSKSSDKSLSAYLIKEGIISEDDLERALDFSKDNNKRFGRALLELGIIDNDTLWESVKLHQKEKILSLFFNPGGNYEFYSDTAGEDENIILDLSIPKLLVEGSRGRKNKNLLEEKLAAIDNVYPSNYSTIDELNLKPYEKHILNIIKRENNIRKILEKSELLRFDTLKLIDLFLIMKIISTNKNTDTNEGKINKVVLESEKISGNASFNSFAEALKFYNRKYEFIYKVFSKEIGPIALSILRNNINEISDNLPVYLRKMKWNANGTINEDLLLKSLYHKDFQENIKVFLTGLEEILYAGIYTIRKNISPEKEKTVLKWINKPAR